MPASRRGGTHGDGPGAQGPGAGEVDRWSRLVLWDVDGTLLDAGGVGAEVFDDAIERVLGVRPPARVRMSGKTDPQIVGEYLASMEVTEPASHVEPVLTQLVAVLAEAEDAVRRRGRALPGAGQVLAALAASGGVLQSVLTGNVAPNAALKVGVFGFERWLDLEVGAYGSDDGDRERLVPVALERSERLRGCRFAPEQVWVVGDTPADLACARAGGARCLLVATGRADYDELAALRPDAVRRDLRDASEVADLLSS